MITQFENGFITKSKLNEMVDGINATVVLTENVTKTVGIGGDFATLNLAIDWCKKVIPNGHTVTLQLVAGFIMARTYRDWETDRKSVV